MVMSIVDCLVEGRFMDPVLDEAYQFISFPHTLPVEKVRRLLHWLRCKPHDAFQLFQAALIKNGCGDFVPNEVDVREVEAQLSSLSPFERCSLELGVPASVVEARRLLCKLYSEAACEVHMMADVSRSSDGSARGLDDVFVNIGLVSSDEVERLCSQWTGKDGGVDEVLSCALQSKQVRLCDMFVRDRRPGANSKDPVRVVAVGTAGSGKSFAFTMKATHDWCGGDFWEEIAFLRTVRCRDKSVWRARNVTELFQLEELGLNTDEVAGVKDFIAKHPERVALVCDGLDEGSVDEGSFLWRVMIGRSLRGLHVIITSRPCSAVRSLSESGAIHRHVQMCGFSEENVHEFAGKYLGQSLGNEMHRQLVEQTVCGLADANPLFRASYLRTVQGGRKASTEKKRCFQQRNAQSCPALC